MLNIFNFYLKISSCHQIMFSLFISHFLCLKRSFISNEYFPSLFSSTPRDRYWKSSNHLYLFFVTFIYVPYFFYSSLIFWVMNLISSLSWAMVSLSVANWSIITEISFGSIPFFYLKFFQFFNTRSLYKLNMMESHSILV